MKTSVIEVHDMLTVFGVDEVEQRIGEVPGVHSVTVNHAAGDATVRYDETRLSPAEIKSTVRQRGYEPAVPVPASGAGDHANHSSAVAPPTPSVPAPPKPPAVVPASSPAAAADIAPQPKSTDKVPSTKS